MKNAKGTYLKEVVFKQTKVSQQKNINVKLK